MNVPTRILVVIAPLNVLFNYLLGASMCLDREFTFLTKIFGFDCIVWGPDSLRLGFIGAPIATALSMNLISIASLAYGVFFVPSTAWHPFTMRIFTNLGVVVRLGLAGTGQ